jgi:hypothetical protein
MMRLPISADIYSRFLAEMTLRHAVTATALLSTGLVAFQQMLGILDTKELISAALCLGRCIEIFAQMTPQARTRRPLQAYRLRALGPAADLPHEIARISL